MKRLATLLFLLALSVAAHAQSFSALLTGANEVPAADPDGAGIAVVTITGTTIHYTVLAQNIGTPTGAHIHRGAAGTNGSIVVNFDVNTLANGSIGPVDQALLNEIIANPSGFYVNVHTSEFPNGAIRGQLASAAAPEGARTIVLPVVGKVTGTNNTNFVTDMRVVNRGTTTANLTLDYFASSGNGQSAPNVTKTVTVAAGEEKVLDDLLGGTLQTSGLGALRVTSDQNVLVSSRVINDLRSSNLGTTGFAMSGSPADAAPTSGTLSFLSQASGPDQSAGVGFRTNVGYFNPSASSVTATFVAHRASDGAVIGTNTVTIPGFSQLQQGVFGLLSNVPDANRAQSNFYITWSSSAPLFVYGSVVDNKTGDSVLIQ
ncbi:MAG TPA: CHRD domain-containing protein [Thermoanaerobaculia bacterium]|nr:CHRD domain-containing protein [Thermoanaerobaculia bacterium]